MALPVGPILARSLYLYESLGVWSHPILARDLYTYENRALWSHPILARDLYTFENRALWSHPILARDLYTYQDLDDGEVVPWLMRLSPEEQVVGGQVDLYGDGLGSIVDVAAGSTITASSTNGGNIPGYATDRVGGNEWASNDGAGSWIRFTFSTAQVVSAIAMTDRLGGSWGVPEFRFSDGGANINGGLGPLARVALNTTGEHPYGVDRTLYTLGASRTSTYLEIRVASGGSGTNRGFSEVWVYADRDTAAEDSQAFLNSDAFGIVNWTNRSPGLYPANGGQPITAAATVTVPNTGESGPVKVVENT